jgi:hypothetical protein
VLGSTVEKKNGWCIEMHQPFFFSASLQLILKKAGTQSLLTFAANNT